MQGCTSACAARALVQAARALVQGCTSARAGVHERSCTLHDQKNFFLLPSTSGKNFSLSEPPHVAGWWQGVGACGRVWGHVAGVWVHERGSGLVNGRRHVAGVGTCGRVWAGMAGGVGTCGIGGGRVWGHVAGV